MKTDYNRNVCSYYSINNKNTSWWMCRNSRQALSSTAKISGSLHPTRTAEMAGASSAVVSQAMFGYVTFAHSYLTDLIHLKDTLNHWNWGTALKKNTIPCLDFVLSTGIITPDLKWVRWFFTQTLCTEFIHVNHPSIPWRLLNISCVPASVKHREHKDACFLYAVMCISHLAHQEAHTVVHRPGSLVVPRFLHLDTQLQSWEILTLAESWGRLLVSWRNSEIIRNVGLHQTEWCPG